MGDKKPKKNSSGNADAHKAKHPKKAVEKLEDTSKDKGKKKK